MSGGQDEAAEWISTSGTYKERRPMKPKHVQQAIRNEWCNTEGVAWDTFLERKMLHLARHVADLQATIAELVKAGTHPDARIVSQVGGMCLDLHIPVGR